MSAPGHVRGAAFAAVFFASGSVLAGYCGDDDCGEHGSCAVESLISKCNCDDGYLSVLTFLPPSSQGAYCVPLPAPLDEPACEGFACGPHGVCVVSGAETGQCICDPGFRPTATGGCEDDPADDTESACQNAFCGHGGTCMATPDATTCRCPPGDFAALGLGADGGLGPVCSTPPNPETACGPEACGPYGECIISQAATCRCEEGATVEERQGSDGRMHPFCVDPDRPIVVEPAPDAGGDDAGVSPPATDAGPIGADAQATTEPRPKASGCSCRLDRDAGGPSPEPLAASILGAFALSRLRRRARESAGALGSCAE